jgi:hypothetical protein
VLVPNGFKSHPRQRITRSATVTMTTGPTPGQPPVPRRTLLVFTMTPHTTQPLVLTHRDAVTPIPSAAQQLLRSPRVLAFVA